MSDAPPSWPANRPRFADILHKAQALDLQLTAEGYEDSDVLASIESETDLLRILDRVTERVIADDRLAATAKARAKRLEARADLRREFLAFVLRSLQRDKLERPLATLYFADNPDAVEILGEVPPEYRTEVPDKAAIAKALKAGLKVANAQLKPGARSLRIRPG